MADIRPRDRVCPPPSIAGHQNKGRAYKATAPAVSAMFAGRSRIGGSRIEGNWGTWIGRSARARDIGTST